MLQQGSVVLGEGAHAEGGGLCWEGTYYFRGGAQGGQESRGSRRRGKGCRPLEVLGAGREGGGFGRGPGHRPMPGTCTLQEPRLSCVLWGARDPGEAVHTGQGCLDYPN